MVEGFKQHNNSIGRGKGIITIYKEDFKFNNDVTKPNYQMTKIISVNMDIINVYRSSSAENLAFINDLCELLDSKKHTLILGDFNICFLKENNNKVFTTLRRLGFKQLVERPSHILGGLIDLVFCYCPEVDVPYDVKQTAQYYLDHDLIIISGKITLLITIILDIIFRITA